MALYIGLDNITGKIRLSKGEVVELTDESLINDLLKANYIKPFTALNTESKDVQGAINELLTKINKLGRESVPLVSRGTKIEANEDINTTKYLKIGTYYCSLVKDAVSLINSPAKTAFMMFVFSLIDSEYDNEETKIWLHRTRIIMDVNGNIFFQDASSAEIAGTFTFGNWKQLH